MHAWWILAVLVLAPAAAAHGAPEPREIDTRLLTDTTEGGDYGGPEGLLGEGGLDLLALDAYEGTMPGTIEPAIVFRLIVQGGDAGEHRIEIAAAAGGASHTLDLVTSDLTSYSSAAFELVRGPFDVGDGHPKAIEGIIRHASLGIAPGDAITDIEAETFYDGAIQDAMPGSWFVLEQEVPLPPTSDAGAPADYATQGPASFFTLSANTSLVPVGEGRTVGLSFTSTLAAMDQVITLSAQAPDGISVSLSDTTVPLPADGDGVVLVEVSGVALGTVKILAQSDLGTARLVSLVLDGAGQIGVGGDVESADIAPGDSYQYTFTAPGTFEYHCHPHPWMTATVTIVERPNGTAVQTHVVAFSEPSSTQAEWRFDPQELTIHTGDTVVWVNEGTVVHTIMGSTGLGAGGHGHDHGDHDHAPPSDAQESPLPLLVPVAALLWVARRRS